MKKIYLIIVFICGAILGRAQELESIKLSFYKKEFAKVKDPIDKYLANPANAGKADAWFYKAVTYNELALDNTASITQAAELNKVSLEAIKKYRQLDPKEELLKIQQNATIFNIYNVYYDLGVKAYNAKNFDQSYLHFNNALDAHDYIYNNNLVADKGFKFSALDTNVVFNLILLGNELKKPDDDMVVYYKKIVDAGLNDEKYLEAYQGITLYYSKKRDQVNFANYLEKGKQHFPKDSFWENVEIESSLEGLENVALFKKYDELGVKYPNNFILFFNYANLLNKYVYSDEPKTGDIAAYKNKIPELYKKAIAIKSTPEANILLANFYYNNSFDISDERGKIKGTTPADVKKRIDLNNASKASLNMSVPYAEEAIKLLAALPKLKASDKVVYKQTLDLLSTVYRTNGDTKKADEYEKKKADVDKL